MVSIIGHRLVSNNRHLRLHDSILKIELDRLIKGEIPHLPLPIPRSAGLFDAALQGDFPQANADAHHRRRWFGRRPTAFLDDDFDGREPFAPLAVRPVTDADELITVLVEKPFGSLLSRIEFSPSIHLGNLPW
jgi:hypothetical protein